MNQFGKISRFEITAASSKSGNTFIKDSFFTSPFKIMKPFKKENGGITVFQQTASPGILAGDIQEHKISVEDGASLEIISQSFEKIFKMEEGESAERKIFATVGEDARLIYAPNPCIPFAKSSFVSSTEIYLTNNSRLIYEDCICAGRVATGELFDFSLYHNLVQVWREGSGNTTLVFRENNFFEGSGKSDKAKELLQSEVMFGANTHSGTLLLCGYNKSVSDIRRILNLEEKLLYADNLMFAYGGIGINVSYAQVEVSPTDYGDIVVRALSDSAQKIQNIFATVKKEMELYN